MSIGELIIILIVIVLIVLVSVIFINKKRKKNRNKKQPKLLLKQKYDRDFKDHPWAKKLGGFLAFLVYGNYISAFISLISLLITSVFMFVASAGLFKAMTDYRAYLNSLTHQTPMKGSIFSYEQLKYLSYTDITGYVAAYVLCLAFLILLVALCIFFLQFSLARNIQCRRIKFLNRYYLWIIILLLLFISYIIMSVAFTAAITDMSNRQPKVDLSGLSSLMYIDYSNLTYIAYFSSIAITLLVSTILFTVYVCNSKRLRIFMGTDLYLKTCIITKYCNSDKLTRNISDNNIAYDNYPRSRANNFCSACGTKLPDDAMFCPNCGNKNST